MKRIAYLLALAGVVTLLGLNAYRGTQLLSINRTLRAERARLDAARAELARAQAARAEALRQAGELAAGAQPERIETVNREAERQEEISDWLERLRRIRGLFARHPEAVIPEMSMMTECQWLAAVRYLDFSAEDGDRAAMAAVRSRAKMDFVHLLSEALRKYTAATGGMLPITVDQLLPYIEKPVPAAAFARYEMGASGRVADVFAGLSAIREREPIDADFDERMFVQSRGGFGSMPWAGSELHDATLRALSAFRKANPKVDLNETPDVTPYADANVRGYMTALGEYRNAHGGAEPDTLEQVLPYARDPATRTTIEQMAKARRRSEKR